MPKPRGNWKVRECAGSVENVIADFARDAGEDLQTGLVDLLVAIQHYAYRHHLNFEAALSSANGHAEVEQVPTFNEGRH